MLTECSEIKAGAFYPELAKAGKKVLKDQAWHGYPVAHRLVQCWEGVTARNTRFYAESVFQHETLGFQLSSQA